MSERRLVIPNKNQVAAVDRIATVDGMISDLNKILKDQIEKQRLKASGGAIFNIHEVKVLGELADAVVKLSREERERLKSEDIGDLFKDLTDEEMLALIKKK